MKKLMILVVSIALIGCATTTTTQKTVSPEEEKYREAIMAFPLVFTIDKSEEKDAWGRAQSFIGQYSSMKVQIVTDYIIQTYTPNNRGLLPRFGYNITKTPTGDSVQISVTCMSDNRFVKKYTALNAHVLAYYIKTGQLYPKYVSK